MPATLLANAETQFLDANGKPLAGGSVYFYIPNTTTPKNTWQDSAQTVLNTNPIILDGAGRAIIWGAGSYRQVVYDQFNNLIWDQITKDSNAGLTGNLTDKVYVAGTDFTPGTTTTLTLPADPGAIPNMWVFFDALFQNDTQYSISGLTITFNSPIPVGVTQVQIKVGTTIAVGSPSVGSVTNASVAIGAAIDARKLAYQVADLGGVSLTIDKVLRLSLTPDNFGAIGDGAADDTNAVQEWLNNSTKCGLVPGDKIYRVSSTVNIPAGFCMHGMGGGFSTSDVNVRILSAVNVDDWSITGKLMLYGPGMNPATQSNGCGIVIGGGQRYKVFGVCAQNFAGWGFLQSGGTYQSPRGNKGMFFGCSAQNCYTGREDAPNTDNSNLVNEYCTWVDFDASGCVYGSRETVGNTRFIGGMIVDNTNGVVLVTGSLNGTHGGSFGRAINHNTAYNVYADTQTAGYQFTGCALFADSATTGLIYLGKCVGVTFTGCMLESSVYTDNATGFGYNFIEGCFNHNNFVLIRGGTNPERTIWKDNYDTNGFWSLNDPSFVFMHAVKSTSQSLPANTSTPIVYDMAVQDVRINFTNGVFRAPVTGTYLVTLQMNLTGTLSSGGYAQIQLQSVDVAYIPIVVTTPGAGIASGSTYVQATQGQVIRICATPQGSGIAIGSGYNDFFVSLG